MNKFHLKSESPLARYKVVFYNPKSGEETTRLFSARSLEEARETAFDRSENTAFELYVRTPSTTKQVGMPYGYHWKYLGNTNV